MRALVALLLSAYLTSGYATPIQLEMDAEVMRQCAIDGGITVYETVKLPPSAFDEWGNVRLYSEQKKEIVEARFHDSKLFVSEYALGTKYLLRYEYRYLRGDERLSDEASISRFSVQLLHMGGRKLLGEGVEYSRRGGDAPGSLGATVFSCPENKTIGDFLSRIFLKN
jgi:hypothetical protein